MADEPGGAEDPRLLLALIDAQEPLEDALARLARTCRDAVPGCTDASVTLLRGSRPSTAASTSDGARAIDEWEYAHECGPCLDALHTAEEQAVADPDEADARWPGIGDVLRASGVVSAAGIPLVAAGEVVGAINLYGTEPGAFDEAAFAVARPLAVQVAVTLHNVRVYDASRELVRQLETAMASRAVIEQAKGILVAGKHCTPEDAFDLLRQASQRENVKLRDVAERIVRSAAGG
ncbi:MAG TPA: GAF and ANTAR domain-containing protein [Mycobacteriales bacterium]|jgi:GAF domain-containing protein|nr:GAF and ANTAR domain-containing protein [Mycobacteriales bacterium]